MDRRFSRDQEKLRERTRAFVQKEVPPEIARKLDGEGAYPHGIMAKLADQGFWGINVAEKYGGLGGGIIELMIFFEEISKTLPVLAWTSGNVLLYGNNILQVNGNEAQQKRFLPGLMNGEYLFCFALTEPDAGSDAANIITRAEPVNGGYRINGSKVFISGASVSHIAVTNTRTASSRYKGITSFLVDTDQEGYTAAPIRKLGYKGSDTCEVYYKDVDVSQENILGGEDCYNQGWKQMMRLLNGERLVLSACALGISETVLKHLVTHVKERQKSSRIQGKYQAVAHGIAEMAARVEAGRQLAFQSAWMVDQEMECVKETSMTKLFCAETGKAVTRLGMEVMGRLGYTMECDVQRFYRDIPILAIGGGTSQIQKNIISKLMGL
ncbi:MAG: acyl-CoA/acyl-ACP dehydrogenase [Desulfobacterium sp.]|nr:acyl-CoA/acyl-ACP dehydrogenase [Desulfobacterium sp.]